MPRYPDDPDPEVWRPWKPERCVDCDARHPGFSRDGMEGPWRCARCDATASPRPKPGLLL